ncbi:hypothetical protein [Clostridium septicum]|uniref:Uncharacterized protein n=1 Tax=Clostridium septicum TaxID=1504 RepID=A0A9N7JP44_CLOSE|nr:hypothetical protein [Clostridium septicum]AYE35421.1 hypothetical protein CP523_13830 [Clostridium septicum]MDU1315273.1 hypothetical protein [Clostridium septicum]QAS60809.1 hypothetical protein EI377_08725 [Clostridium septicum]UEC19923.1 hypothetical protein LK444_10940 [Clostridium septicum]USS02017.1 hypothetical protein NH397_06225 [Clostridium septicum]
MACIKEFKSDKCDLTAICLNYPDTEEEFQTLSNVFYKSMIEGLERQFGTNWGTEVMKKVKSKN